MSGEHIGYRVLIKKIEPIYGLPESGNQQGIRRWGERVFWKAEDTGLSKKAANKIAGEKNRGLNSLKRIFLPNAKVVPDVV